MKNKPVNTFVRIFGLVLLTCYTTSASADFVQTMGMSNREGALAGATQGVAADASTWYVNPAGAAEFKKPVISLGLRFVDTNHLTMDDSGGSYDVEATTVNGEIAAAPGLGIYLPLSEKITAGVGLGVPFALTADWENDAGVHRYSFSNQAFFTVDLAAVVGMEVTDRLNVGVAVNLVAFKHLTVERLVPVTALGGHTGPNELVVGRILLETEMDFPLFVPPFQFDPAFDEIGFTIGAKYDVSDDLTFGVSYRSEQDTTFDGEATIDFNNPLGLGKSIVPWKLDFDTPAHIKAGFAYDMSDALTWSVDLQYTFWSDADAVGNPANIKFGEPLSGLVGPVGPALNGVTGVTYDWDGDDTLAVAAGVQFRLNDKLTLLGGYRYDPETAPDDAIDVLFWSGDRHWVGAGATYDLTNSDGRGWTLTAGYQGVIYEDRLIKAGASRNMGGFSKVQFDSPGVLTNVTSDEDFEFGGIINLLGVDITYSF